MSVVILLGSAMAGFSTDQPGENVVVLGASRSKTVSPPAWISCRSMSNCASRKSILAVSAALLFAFSPACAFKDSESAAAVQLATSMVLKDDDGFCVSMFDMRSPYLSVRGTISLKKEANVPPIWVGIRIMCQNTA